MAINQPLFKKGNLFNSFKEFQERLKLYNSSTGYNFNTRHSTTLSNTATTKQQFNKDIIYCDKYLKCEINPKKAALEKFQEENPEITVEQCPAELVLRATKDKQKLQITKFNPEHDHDPSDKEPRLTKYKKLAASLADNNTVDSFIRTENVEVLEARHPVSNSLHNQEIPDENLISTPLSSTISCDVSNNQQRQPLTLELIHVKTSSTPPVASELADGLEYIPIIFEEDFDKLMISLETNIGSTIDKYQQQVEMRRVTEILNKFHGTETECDKSTLGSLSIHLSQSRGRSRSRRNRVIGLPASGRKNSVESFENLGIANKKKYLLELILSSDQGFIKEVAFATKKIEICNIMHLEVNMPDALGSELVQPEILNRYFEGDAYKKLINLIKKKREGTDWSCDMCHKDLGISESIECDKCLYWSHWDCVGIKEEPSDWFCPKCQKA